MLKKFIGGKNLKRLKKVISNILVCVFCVMPLTSCGNNSDMQITTGQTNIQTTSEKNDNNGEITQQISKKEESTEVTKSLSDKKEVSISEISFKDVKATSDYQKPESFSETYNMNIGWKFAKAPNGKTWPLETARQSMIKDGKNFYDIDYDDSEWDSVSLPHAISADMAFANNIVDAGDNGVYRGFSFYRKKFTVPEKSNNQKVFIEFEGIRQAAYVWVNGNKVGYYEAGVTAFGFDITDFVVYGQENVIAVANDATSARGMTSYMAETKPGSDWGKSDGEKYQWNTNDFNPTQAGLTQNVRLYVKPEIYQTLPLYNNLKTTGNYIYGSDFDIKNKKVTINVDVEIRNESSEDKDVILEVNVVDREGKLKYKFETSSNVKAASDKGVIYETAIEDDVYSENPNPTSVNCVNVTHIYASYQASDIDFWSIDIPYLYDIYTIIKVDGLVIDVDKITTGFRKVDYSLEKGLKLNDEYVFLTGYAQRSTNEWATIGVANDWIADYDMQLIKESNANYIRWMHVAPKANYIRSGDKYGIVSIVPAGDKEKDVEGRQWSQRVEAMRDTIIYYRNSPSVIFWEAGNNAISGVHMKEMREIKDLLDPNGGRFIGCRAINTAEQLEYAEWIGTMLNRNAGKAMSTMKKTGVYLPILETEYHREEAPRRVWDDYSPPDYDYDNKWLLGQSKKDGYDVHDFTSESFVLNDAKSYAEFYGNRVNGPSGLNYYSAAAALVWADSNQHGRNSGSENCRTSGRVDAVRIKKQSFYSYQVMQSRKSLIHIVGHWSYEPLNDDTYWYKEKVKGDVTWKETGKMLQRNPLNKTVYVVGTTDCAKIDLLVDGKIVGTSTKAQNYFIYSFENIDVTKGDKVEAIAYNEKGEIIAKDEIKRSGEAYAIRLTPIVSTDGFLADGADILVCDVDVVDKDGNICVLNYDKITFSIEGEGIFLGGYNSGLTGSESVIGKDFVYAECGQNRVFIRSTDKAGEIILTASMEGLEKDYAIKLNTKEINTEGGLTIDFPSTYYQMSFSEEFFKNAINGPDLYVTTLKNIPVSSEKEENKNYSVVINSTRLNFTTSPYKQDDVTGVVAPVKPILDKLKNLGCEFEYNINGSEFTLKTSSNTVIATVGDPALKVNGEGDLMNISPEIINGELCMELNAILKYIEKITIDVNDEYRIYTIKVKLY